MTGDGMWMRIDHKLIIRWCQAVAVSEWVSVYNVYVRASTCYDISNTHFDSVLNHIHTYTHTHKHTPICGDDDDGGGGGENKSQNLTPIHTNTLTRTGSFTIKSMPAAPVQLQ